MCGCLAMPLAAQGMDSLLEERFVFLLLQYVTAVQG